MALAPAAGAGFFSPDYVTARSRFRAAARICGAKLDELPLAARGPRSEELTIDLAWLGPRKPRHALLHISGVHGVEAFAGSATQLALLEKTPSLPADGALILVHVLNPWGMAWLRRTNEHNVDLNRNFHPDNSTWTGSPPLYNRIDSLLNPASPPNRDAFVPRIVLAGLRHGTRNLRQAIAHGQHRYPRGLFYGGSGLQPGLAVFSEWIRSELTGLDSLFVIDMHTGLGPHASDTLIAEPAQAGTTITLEQILQRRIAGGSSSTAAYTVRGSLGSALPRLLPGVRTTFLLQEIGTWSPLRVLHALREENRWHHYGNGGTDHSAKRRLLEALCPAAPAWRDAAVAHGIRLVQQSLRHQFQEKSP